jgi:hypothetical protein
LAVEVVADKVGLGNEADAIGQKRLVDLHLLQADRAVLPPHLSQTGQIVDEFPLAFAPQGEGEPGAERQPMQHGSNRKADQRCRSGAAENDDDGVNVVQHPKIAAHEDERRDNHGPGHKADGG